jgi:2-oxoglutarate dehydrogenase complex dehydrogenase (E1) component-like enzyme
MLQIPIFHVNGEDPEAVAQVVSLAMDFRSEFQRDVVIDMYCFRRRGITRQTSLPLRSLPSTGLLNSSRAFTRAI